MKNYIPNRTTAQSERVRQTKFVTDARSFSRNGRAKRVRVETDFETTFRTFIEISK